ncbi:MAG: DUF4445 domain-containing protein [Methylobacteriaceae bacterium]|nr:DUF4445 domain-containing protein [Rhodoblastus sp.]MCC0005606.1 DUF4445 domain-containing protein [Methylobacteriaceae bacterium]
MDAHSPVATYRVRFAHLDREIDCAADETIFHAARRSGVRIVGACGGRGACGSCMVRAHDGKLTDDEGAEIEGGRKWAHACRVRPTGDCAIEIAPRSLAQVTRADVHARDEAAIAPAPAVSFEDVTVPPATLVDHADDFSRVRRAMGARIETIDIEAARALPQVLRDNDWAARVYSRDGRIVGIGAPGRRAVGLAIDLGTTNVVGFLLDLETGARLASLGIENPQVAWGADLVSRINHAVGGRRHQDELQAAARTAINALGHDLARAVGLRAHDIRDVTICGNTAMQHLLLSLPVRQLGRAPFVAAAHDAMDLFARDLGLDFAVGARVHVAGNVGGFVGSDHVAALLATRARWEQGGVSLVMDIGTNTEISLMHDGQIVSASCPSGPALEGGHISCGMRAADGAIERVRIEDGRLRIATIANAAPVGVCGSGVLDAIAAGLRLGLVDKGGRIGEGYADVIVDGSRRVIRLADGVQVVQNDVRAVQLAKSAVRTGVDLLLERMGLSEQRIDRFILAGAFGAYIDLDSAMEIGLLPRLAREKFAQVGNAAGVGVARMLASTAERKLAREIAARCAYVELSTNPQFQKRFMKNIGFSGHREERAS